MHIAYTRSSWLTITQYRPIWFHSQLHVIYKIGLACAFMACMRMHEAKYRYKIVGDIECVYSMI